MENRFLSAELRDELRKLWCAPEAKAAAPTNPDPLGALPAHYRPGLMERLERLRLTHVSIPLAPPFGLPPLERHDLMGDFRMPLVAYIPTVDLSPRNYVRVDDRPDCDCCGATLPERYPHEPGARFVCGDCALFSVQAGLDSGQTREFLALARACTLPEEAD